MKKTRFFYGTNCLLLAFLGWGILFNTALEKQILQDGNMQSSDMHSSDMQSRDDHVWIYDYPLHNMMLKQKNMKGGFSP